jgi:hypothetical protein
MNSVYFEMMGSNKGAEKEKSALCNERSESSFEGNITESSRSLSKDPAYKMENTQHFVLRKGSKAKRENQHIISN